jgi:hypothetical protein
MSALTATSGGAQAQSVSISWVNKEVLNIVVLLFIVVGIAFVGAIPLHIRKGANTSIGGLVGLGLISGLYFTFGWLPAFMGALLFILTINSGILYEVDGFEPGIDVRVISNSKKWYIERILGENPFIIEEDTVKTQAIQDNSSGQNSLSSR